MALLDILGLNGSSSSSSPSSTTPTTTTSTSSTSAGSVTTSPTKPSSSPTKAVAADTATLSDAARSLLSGSAPSAPGTPIAGTLPTTYSGLSGSGTLGNASASIGQQKAAQRASSMAAQYSDAVSTVGNVTRMNQAYGSAAASDVDSSLRNSFNRLFAKNANSMVAEGKGDKSAPTTSSSDAREVSASA